MRSSRVTPLAHNVRSRGLNGIRAVVLLAAFSFTGCGAMREAVSTVLPLPGVALRVTDRAGVPLPDVRVVALDDDVDDNCTAVDGGVHVLGCADGEPIRISVYKPGYEHGFLYLTKTSARLHLTLALARIDELAPDDTTAPRGMGSLRGQLIDEDGKPVLGGTIKLVGEKRRAYSKPPAGEFNLRSVAPGSYEAEISVIGSMRVRVTFNVAADSAVYWLIQLRDDTVRGRCLPLWDPHIAYIIRDRAATVRDQNVDEISDRPTRSLQETVRSMGSIRYDDPDGGPR